MPIAGRLTHLGGTARKFASSGQIWTAISFSDTATGQFDIGITSCKRIQLSRRVSGSLLRGLNDEDEPCASSQQLTPFIHFQSFDSPAHTAMAELDSFGEVRGPPPFAPSEDHARARHS